MNLSIIFVPTINSDAEAKVTVAEGDFGKFSIEAGIAVRYENWDWFKPAVSTADNSYGYYFTRSRLGIELENKAFRAYMQIQDVHMFDLPENSLAAPPQGPLGIGAIYYLHNMDDNPNSLIIRQAYIDLPKILSSPVSLRLGRFDYVDGTEVMYTNPKVNKLTGGIWDDASM